MLEYKKEQIREFRFDEKSNEIVIEWERRVSGDEAIKSLSDYKESKVYELQDIVSKIKALKGAANKIRNEIQAIDDLRSEAQKPV